jgi:hypothetical protein
LAKSEISVYRPEVLLEIVLVEFWSVVDDELIADLIKLFSSRVLVQGWLNMMNWYV